jgi:subtilisin
MKGTLCVIFTPMNLRIFIHKVAIMATLAIGVLTFRAQSEPLTPAGPLEATLLVRESAQQGFGVQRLMQRALAEGSVPVILKLRTDVANPNYAEAARNDERRRALVAAAQDGVLSELASIAVESVKRFPFIPYLAMTVDAAGLEWLMHSDRIEEIHEDGLSTIHMAESVPLIKAPQVWAMGYTGMGQAVAVLDSGVDKTHPFLAGRVVSEACFSSNEPSYSATSLCPGGVTASTSPGSGEDCTLTSASCWHGTLVAGIVSGSQSAFSGVAKNAGIISIQVMTRFDNTSVCGGASTCIASFDSDQIAALQHVYALSGAYSIAAVNMSMGGGSYSGNCDSDSRKEAIDQLRSVGIATVVSTGNDGFTGAMEAPACISSAISVGASGDGSGNPPATVDTERSYSDSATFMSFLAPGSLITGPVPVWYNSSGYITGYGTSFAAPHVAGAWALLKQALPGASVSQIQGALTNTGTMIPIRAGGTKPRIDVYQAARSLGIGYRNFIPLVIK